MRGRASTDATRRAAVEAYRRGDPVSDILATAGISTPGTLRNWLKMAGVEWRSKKRKGRRVKRSPRAYSCGLGMGDCDRRSVPAGREACRLAAEANGSSGAVRRAVLASVATSVVDRIPAGSPLLGCHGVSYGVVRPESRELAEALRVACEAREPMDELADVAILGSIGINVESGYREHVAESLSRRRAMAGARMAGVRIPFDRLVGA